eukprot:TRINITY_DN2249_c0_g1_i1.p1 TRINITY_DN2249_c0_g1~~TRINITY_DN2249_c0_g1_i1.p1  ORF type:complete len:520 (-),score=93.02 TRINITY_DN2249_c0_g1_i1:164-1723(-)
MLQTCLLILTGLLAFVFGFLQLKIAAARRKITPYNFCPPENTWLSGHYPTNITGNVRQWNDWTLKFKAKILFCRFYFTPFLFISDFAAIKNILNNEEYFSKGYLYRPYKLWFARGLTPTEGEEAKQTRKKLAPAFAISRLHPFVPLFNRLATLLFDTRWTNEKYVERLPNGAIKVALFDDLRLLAFDSVGTCSGLSLNTLCDESPKALDAFTTIWNNISSQRLQNARNPLFRLLSRHVLPNGRKFYHAILFLQGLATEAINRRKSQVGHSNDHGVHDLLYHLMEQTDFEEIKVRDLVINFLFAGSDIVGAMMAWTLVFLAKNPEIQEKLVGELRGACSSKDHVLDTEVSKVPLLLASMKEALRLFPPVPLLSRRCEKPFKIQIQEDGKKPVDVNVEVGSEVFMNLWHAQKEGTWDRANEFDPARFLGTSGVIAKDAEKNDEKDKSMGAFCPFSIGRRNCIGQTFAMTEGCVVLSRLLLRYKVSLAEPDVDVEKMPLVFNSALQPKSTVWFILESRAERD